MRKLESVLLYSSYALLGTYAVPALRFGYGEGQMPYAALTIVALLGTVMVSALARPKSYTVPKVLRWYAYFVVIALLLSTLVSRFPAPVAAVKYGLFAMLPVLIYLTAREPGQLWKTTTALFMSSVAVVAYGAYGFFTGEVGSVSEHALGYFGVTYEESTRNTDVLYISTAFWMVSAWLCWGPRSSVPVRLVALGVCVALALALVMTFSRGAWVTVPMSFALVWIAQGKRLPFKQVAGAGLCVLVLSGLTQVLLEEYTVASLMNRAGGLFSMSERGGSNLARLAILNESLGAIGNSWGFGVGADNLRYALTNLPFGRLNHAENAFMQILAEQGIIGLSAFVWLLASVLRRGRYACQAVQDKQQLVMVYGLGGLTLNWALYGFFNLLVDSLWFWMVLALSTACMYRTSGFAALKKGSTVFEGKWKDSCEVPRGTGHWARTDS